MIILPILLITGGGAAIIAAIASGFGDGEPAPPVPMPDEPVTPAAVPAGTPLPAPLAKLDPKEVEALARVIASEAGSGSPIEMRAIAWTVRNRAKGKSLYSIFYPWRAQSGSNPPASSARPATMATGAIAEQVLSLPQSADPTGGATSFFEPKMQDIFFKAGELARSGEKGDRVIDGVKLTDITRFKNYRKNAQQIRESWSKGSTLYATAGRFEFWGSSGVLARRGGSPVALGGDGSTAGDGIGKTFKDIPDPLAVIRKLRG